MEAETATIAWLSDHIDACVDGIAPKKRPPRLVTVERTGGGESDGIDDARLAVQCWAETPALAADLAREVADLLPDMADEPWACLCEIESRYRFPATDDNAPRYQLTVRASVYA